MTVVELDYGFPRDANQVVRALSAHLAALKGQARMPRPADIRPEALPRGVLPNVILVDVEGDSGPGSEGPWRFRFRLLGENIREATGQRWAGQYLTAELVGADRLAIFRAAYEAPLRQRRPTVAEHTFINFARDTTYDSLRYLFPLSADDRIITRLIGFQPIRTGPWQSGGEPRED